MTNPVTLWCNYMKEKTTHPVLTSGLKLGVDQGFCMGKGPSMVAELKMFDGNWEAFMADRFPEQLDDEIKR
eukprot:7606127-Prorocentrum_lima.AAC.1